jgi:hypothetical protein
VAVSEVDDRVKRSVGWQVVDPEPFKLGPRPGPDTSEGCRAPQAANTRAWRLLRMLQASGRMAGVHACTRLLPRAPECCGYSMLPPCNCRASKKVASVKRAAQNPTHRLCIMWQAALLECSRAASGASGATSFRASS